MESTHKTLLAIVVSTLFATDYGISYVSNAYSTTRQEKIQASELREEETEETQRMKLLMENCRQPTKKVAYHAPFSFHRSIRHA